MKHWSFFPETVRLTAGGVLVFWMILTDVIWGATPATPYKWYYHTSSKNETQAALQAAVANHCGVLVFVGNPGCSVCAGIWGSSMMDGTGKMATFLKNNKLVGIYVEDSTTHYQKLANGARGYKNPDGSRTESGPPFLAFVKVKDDCTEVTSLNFSGSDSVVDVFFCGSTGVYLPKINYTNVTNWLTNLMQSDAYKSAWPASPVGDDDSGDDDDDPIGDDDDDDDDDPVNPVVVNKDAFKWYYHTSSKNETQKALQAAIANRCGLLVFVGNPGCSVCAGIWGSSMMDGTGRMQNFLKSECIVGLYVEDSTTHYQKLANGARGYKNPDGSRTEAGPPFLVFVKVKDDCGDVTSLNFSGSDSVVDVFFCGSTGVYLPKINYANVTSWLTNLMSSDAYTEACPGPVTDRTPELEEPNPLEFFMEDPAVLGTTVISGVECYSSGNAVRSAATSLSSGTKERYFKFHAVAGNRYVFSVTAVRGGLSLSDLVAQQMNLTCAVYSIESDGGPSATPVFSKSNAQKGFLVLDEGFFFVPTKTADYYLRISTTTKLSQEISFNLRYHCTAIGASGSLGMPLWAGVEPGKWSMDYDAAVTWSVENDMPFLLYFAGSTWCPSCATFEHLVAESAGFKAATGDMPMVLMDNRRRGEVTGPTLLYAPDYQTYIQAADATADVEAKLQANKQLQNACQEPGKTKVNYPSLLLCQGKADGSLRVVSRVDMESVYPIGVTKSPVGTDFSALGATTVAKLLALLGDPYEESDNYASTTTAVLKPDDEVASVEWEAIIGGYDAADWRTLQLASTRSWRFSVKGDFEPTAQITIGIYDEMGSGAQDGNLLERDGEALQTAGTGAALPHLDFVPSELRSEWNCRMKIAVSGQNEAVVYQLVCSDLEPYDIGFAEEERVVYVRQKDGGQVVLNAPWARTKETNEVGTVVLALDGPGECDPSFAFGGAGAENGTLEMPVTGLGGTESSAVPAETTVTLMAAEANGNCHVSETGNKVIIRTVSLPCFVDEENEATKELFTLCENTDFEMTFPVCNGLTDTTKIRYDEEALPAGLALEIRNGEAGQAELVLSGRPAEAFDEARSVAVQLLTENDQEGASMVLALKVRSLAEINPVAALTQNYTGYLTEKGKVTGIFTMKRQEDKSLAVGLSFVNPQRSVTGTADAWSVKDETGAVVTSAALEDGTTMTLELSADGIGSSGYGNAVVSFLPNMSSEEAKKEYAGLYNVALKVSHPDYLGYSWVTLTIDEDGQAVYSGTLPNGRGFVGEISLVEIALDNGNSAGQCTILADEVVTGDEKAGYIGGHIQVEPRSVRSAEDPSPCILPCENKPELSWYDVKRKRSYALSLSSGVEYLPGTPFTEQTNRDLYLYVCSADLWELPENYPPAVSPLLLPSGIAIEEAADGKFQAKASAFANAPAKPYQDLAGLDLQYDIANGLFAGTLEAVTSTGGTTQLSFSGILTPIPPSSCGCSGGEEVAYGSIRLADDATKSWPICLMADEGLTASSLEELFPALPTVSIVDSSVLAVSGADEERGGYVLLNDEETIVAVSANGQFPVAELPAGECRAAIVANGLLGESVPFAKTGFAVELADDVFNAFTDEDGDDATRGWLASVMPTDGVLLDSVPVIAPNNAKAVMVNPVFVVFAYPEDSTSAVQIRDWSELEPGQAFWVYFNKAAVGTSNTLVSAPEATMAAIESSAAETTKKFVFQTAPTELPEDAQFWIWQGGEYRPAAEGVGWLEVAE